ncbi:glycosyltransferase family 2 protein [Nonomuraea sp. H19]|uniref:glycosyltransferase family 2 protein n=1 Tax=Nonomuraea sp. H19 TaxID=3452206 RepID=UPI003F8AF7EB
MIPLLSVVVPVYNVEPYITECLKSLAAQTLDDIEVVLVDDGSCDGSRQVAEDFAARDRRFIVIEQRNQGPGPARNAGIQQARGAYLAFADADDVVPPQAYERLLATLAETGSDLACGAVRRLVDGELEESILHEKVFRRPVLCTHITDKQVLIRDRTVWNKVYRRDFWERNGLEFPAGIYEDVPVAMQAHVLATSVDMVGDVVYHWRRRDDEGETSITQRRAEPDNLHERLTAIRAVRAFLDERAPELRDGFDALVLEKDFVFLFQALETSEEPEQLLDLARSWVAELGQKTLEDAPSLRRLELHLLSRGLVAELRKIRQFRRSCVDGTRIVPRGWRTTGWYGDYPFFRNWRLKIPDEIFEATNEIKLIARVEECEWTGAEYRVRGHVAMHRVDRRVGRLDLWLCSGRRRIPLEVRRRGRHGFETVIDPGQLDGGGPSWRLQVRVETRGLVLKGWFRDGEANSTWRFSVPGWSRTGMDITQ